MNNIISIAADFSNDKCYPTAYVVKGDTGNVFNISIHKDGASADLSDITLALITFRQDDFSASQEGKIDGNIVSFTLNPACVRIGANLGEVALYHDDTLVTTALFCVAVRSSLQDEGTTIPEEESPTLIELIEKYSGGSGGKQVDWNQNDDTQPDYVKNRPFYTGDPVETVLVEESSVSFALSGGFYNASFPTSFNAEFGQTYKISWDGTVYECTCKDFRNFPIIGNQSIMGLGSDTGEPFIIFNETGLNETGWVSLTKDTSASHTISISANVTPITKIDEKYIPKLPYMDKVNPTGTGSFSLNRKADTTIGRFSFAEGQKTTASGNYSHAEGYSTTASGLSSHAEGESTTASGYPSHAEGYCTTASGSSSHAEGYCTTASGSSSHAEGWGTKASSKNQHVQGKYNVEDSAGVYAHIVGNGTSDSERSNAHTLNYDGTAWYAKTVKVGGTGEADGQPLATEEFVTNAINAALYVDSETEVG